MDPEQSIHYEYRTSYEQDSEHSLDSSSPPSSPITYENPNIASPPHTPRSLPHSTTSSFTPSATNLPTTNSSHPLPSSHRSRLSSEAMIDPDLADCVLERLKEVVGRFDLNPQQKQDQMDSLNLTEQAVQEACLLVAGRSKQLDMQDEELERRELLLGMRELVVAAEVERNTRRLEELSEALVARMDALEALHDALAPALAARYNATLTTLAGTEEANKETQRLSELIDRREGSQTSTETPSWPELHPGRGELGHGVHFRVGKEEVFLHADTGEVWVRVRPLDLDNGTDAGNEAVSSDLFQSETDQNITLENKVPSQIYNSPTNTDLSSNQTEYFTPNTDTCTRKTNTSAIYNDHSPCQIDEFPTNNNQSPLQIDELSTNSSKFPGKIDELLTNTIPFLITTDQSETSSQIDELITNTYHSPSHIDASQTSNDILQSIRPNPRLSDQLS